MKDLKSLLWRFNKELAMYRYRGCQQAGSIEWRHGGRNFSRAKWIHAITYASGSVKPLLCTGYTKMSKTLQGGFHTQRPTIRMESGLFHSV